MDSIRAAMDRRLYPERSLDMVSLVRLAEDYRGRMDAEYQRAVLGEMQALESPPLGVYQHFVGWL
jgi:hypothetical protein